MNRKTLAAIALSNRDFDSFDHKLAEAVQWIDLAAQQGADLIVLPETINLYCGDGVGNPNALRFADAALDDWQTQCAVLIDAAKRNRTTVAIPILERIAEGLSNCFYLVGPEGNTLGCYHKTRPPHGELDEGVVPGAAPDTIAWEGLNVGGAICFDTHFPELFEHQIQQGADLFLAPSLWPGGDQLNHIARTWSTPIVLSYPAWSRIIDIDGRNIAEGGYRHETLRFGFGSPIVMATINFDRAAFHGEQVQAKAVEIQQRYGSQVRVVYDQPNCDWYIESLSDQLTVADIQREFELDTKAEYLARYRTRLATLSRF